MTLKPFVFSTLLLTLLATSMSFAEDNMVADTDGEIGPNEYIAISPNGGITRRPCPYTCEMRGIPREHCKEWKGVDKTAPLPECYVHDLRLPSDAVRFGGESEHSHKH